VDDIDDQGRPEPPPAGTEAQTLLGFLEHQRATLAWKCSGVDDDQLRTRLAPSVLTLGGLLKHLARVEDGWFGAVVAGGERLEPWRSTEWGAEWLTAAGDSGDHLRALWASRVENSRRVVASALQAGSAALGTMHAAQGEDERTSLRWVLVHMIEEYARHNGHADLLRESIDGATGE
jgi:uncharacterized damage-inducible protein DinB